MFGAPRGGLPGSGSGERNRSPDASTFVAWLETGAVGVGTRRVEQWMKIAAAFADSKPCFESLPAGDSLALYELARLDPPQLTAAIEAGEVTPDMGRKDARALVGRYRIKEVGNAVALTLVVA